MPLIHVNSLIVFGSVALVLMKSPSSSLKGSETRRLNLKVHLSIHHAYHRTHYLQQRRKRNVAKLIEHSTHFYLSHGVLELLHSPFKPAEENSIRPP